MEKSHVGMGHSVCPVCMEEHTKVVLLNTKLKKTLTKYMFMGWALCSLHKQQEEDDFGFIIGMIPQPGGKENTLENLNRTGDIISIKKSVAKEILDMTFKNSIAFGTTELIEDLKKMQKG